MECDTVSFIRFVGSEKANELSYKQIDCTALPKSPPWQGQLSFLWPCIPVCSLICQSASIVRRPHLAKPAPAQTHSLATQNDAKHDARASSNMSPGKPQRPVLRSTMHPAVAVSQSLNRFHLQSLFKDSVQDASTTWRESSSFGCLAKGDCMS